MPVVHTLKRAARLRYFIHEGLNIRLARASVFQPALILAHPTFTQDSSHVLQPRFWDGGGYILPLRLYERNNRRNRGEAAIAAIRNIP